MVASFLAKADTLPFQPFLQNQKLNKSSDFREQHKMFRAHGKKQVLVWNCTDWLG
jgi:hypothetical protein